MRLPLLSGHATGVTVSVRSLYSYTTAATVICCLCKVCLRLTAPSSAPFV